MECICRSSERRMALDSYPPLWSRRFGRSCCSSMTLIDKRLPEFTDPDLFTITFQSNLVRNTVKQGGLLLTVLSLSGNSQRFIRPSIIFAYYNEKSQHQTLKNLFNQLTTETYVDCVQNQPLFLLDLSGTVQYCFSER